MKFQYRFNSEFIRRLLPRVSGLADQAFLSGVSFVQTAAYVRHLSPESFGAFSLFYYTIILATSVQRATAVTPMIVSIKQDNLGEIRIWSACALATSVAMVVLFFLAWVLEFVAKVDFDQFPLLYCALGTLPFLAFEFHRRSLFLQRKPLAAACCSATFFVLQCIGTALALWMKLNLPAIVAIYIANSALASLLARTLSLKDIPRRPEKGILTVRKHGHLILWNLASLAPYMIYNNAMPIIVSAVFGIRDSAVYSATRILIAPIMMLVSAVDSTDKPRAARALQTAGIPGLFKSLRQTGLTLFFLASPYLAALIFFPQEILHFAVGGKYSFHVELIPYWVAIAVIFLVGQPLESGLVVLRRSDLFFWSRSAAAVLTVLLILMNRQDPNGALAGIRSTAWAWGISSLIALLIMFRVAKTSKPT